MRRTRLNSAMLPPSRAPESSGLRRPPAAPAAAPRPPCTFDHLPVLLPEVLALAAPAAPRLIVDCTLGGAGHAQALLEAFPAARLIGLDRDPTARAAAAARLAPFGRRAEVVAACFSSLQAVLAERQLGAPELILADFGVSSPQLDVAARGFSFRADGPLDMRMDPEVGRTAAQVLAELDVDQLRDAIGRLGEERYAGRVARAIVAAQPQTTLALATVVRTALPPSRERLDPATRTFQALRILVNDELGEIERLLAPLPLPLAVGGRFLAISFHSLEDRAVKHGLRRAAQGCTCPPQLPVCCCHKRPQMRVLTPRAVRPDADAVAANPRARSARLRAAERLGAST